MPRTKNAPSQRNRGRLRIIGGQWKRHTLYFNGGADLRPTPDAIREKLFNWLAPVIEGACCLDLFCGSGALGFEAASRGAALVILVDNNRQSCEEINKNRGKRPQNFLGAFGAESEKNYGNKSLKIP